MIIPKLNMIRINKIMTYPLVLLFITIVLLLNNATSMRINDDLVDLPETYLPDYEHILSSRPRLVYRSRLLRPYRTPFYQDNIEKKNRKVDQAFYSYYG
ncbi:hypothetical protein MN116_002702 [Schistosoma mekongi]|uniref:Uncharacterized protein n=1 Tax=Schistosoma mekongi TaxID=38744 RepID=A0AAE1ZFF9_SCHME|nr:hypothetical protein MN116_002702 [Schistosoma mekongi]